MVPGFPASEGDPPSDLLTHLSFLGDLVPADLELLDGLVLHGEGEVRAVPRDLQQRRLEVRRVRLVRQRGRPAPHRPLQLLEAPLLHVREAGVEGTMAIFT